MRRRFKLIIMAMTIGMVMASCAEDDGYSDYHTVSTEIHFLRGNDAFLEFLAEDQSMRYIDVEAEGVSWAFSGMSNWLHLSNTNGTYDMTVSATVDQNFSGDDMRTSLFKLYDTSNQTSYKMDYSATQYAAEPYIKPSTTDVSLSGAAFTATYTVDTNVNWTADVSSSWLSAKKSADGKSIVVDVDENTESTSRIGFVYLNRVADGKTYAIIKFTQKRATASFENDATLMYGQSGGTYELKLYSEASWSAYTSDSWIEVSPDEGKAGESILRISTVPNMTEKSLSGRVYIKIGSNNAANIYIQQEGINLTVEPTNLNFLTNGEEKEIKVTTNTPCNIISCPSWITVSDKTISESKTITLTASPNYSTLNNSGTLKIGINGTTITRSISVSQAGWSMSNLIGTLSYDDDAIDDTINVDRFGVKSDWTVYSNAEWIKVSPESGALDAAVVFSIDENISDDTRTGYVLFSFNDAMYPVEVNQAGKYFTISPTIASLTSRGGTHRVQITTNDEWTATTGSPWMTLSATSGSGDIDVLLTADDNPSINIRRDTTIFSPAYLQPVKVVTRQKARYLNVNTTGVFFFRKGGESDTIKITTDADYEVSTDVNWLTASVNKETNGFTVIASRNTMEDSRIGKIIISMIGLVNGENYEVEIPVTQKGTRETIVVNPYDPDENWQMNLNGKATLSIIGYGTDENWNPNGENVFTVRLTGYSGDENWNPAGGTGANIDMNGHGNDGNWNPAGDTNGDISNKGHGSDENWNPDGDTDGNITKEDHGDEEDWSPDGDTDGDIDKGDYGDDEDWSPDGDTDGDIDKGDYGDDEDWNQNN